MKISGHADERFGCVADEFAVNFAERGELGAAFALYVDGREVVSLWGGVADKRRGRVWSEDTCAVIFSCTKGLMALCLYHLVGEGRLDLDFPVATYWPEFAQSGKGSISVRCALSHRAGLPALDLSLSRKEVFAWAPVIHALEVQRPLWEPGTSYMYHPLTVGWIAGELIRRLSARSARDYFRERIAEPLGLRTAIGRPSDDQEDIATIHAAPPETAPDALELVAVSSRLRQSNDVIDRSTTLGGAFPSLGDPDALPRWFNDTAVRAAELPAANGISSARDLAKLYSAAVTEVEGVRLMSDEAIDDALLEQSTGTPWLGLDAGRRWATGFQIDSPPLRPMLGPRSFGHDGAGGQLAFADADHKVGYGYVTNQMGGVLDTRANRLTEAVRSCL